MNTRFWSCLWIILKKDLKVELRNKEIFATLGLFGLVLSFIFAFGFIGDPKTNLAVIPGILWSGLLFTGALSIGRTFSREQENQVFTALLLSPASRTALLNAKILINLILMIGSMILITPLIALLLHVDLTPYLGPLSLFLVLSCIGFAIVGTPLAVMAINARFPEVLLPMIVFPLITPILICGVRGCTALFGTSTEIEYWSWIKLILAFDLTMWVGGFLLFDRMLEE